MSRALATIQTIKSISPIPGADLIVLAEFQSIYWQCVMKKSEAQTGSKVVYFEIDSLLDAGNPIFSFMADRKYRIKTIKLRGQISQGLAIPLNQFEGIKDGEDGTDLTEVLKITKYVPPEELACEGGSSNSFKEFPSFIYKTDEPRAQTLTNLETILATQDLKVTIKLDGTSATYYHFQEEFGICSRKLKFGENTIQNKNNVHFFEMAARYDIENRLKTLGRNVAIQGEIIGPRINGNRLKIATYGFYVFTGQDLLKGKRMTPGELDELIKELNEIKSDGIPLVQVPSLGKLTPGTLKSYGDLLELSKGDFGLSKELREGIVCRNDNLSFKVINPEYLLKHKI
ncbi:hypothetical protein HK103_003831 [Boothiomyces macroporosus]|uniref:RNA ligase domain-containing protein n=1 Tax=Boothiomyces macroporosus TaxID=261099 RepID=A0AAD5Y6V2_9FUNG|nr:hypothetical protein HK103_003831 [Boothiomyces macroporosus]